MESRTLILFITIAISLLSANQTNAANPPKAGSPCSKIGISQYYLGKKYTCIKSGKKLVWDKGVSSSVTRPSPSSDIYSESSKIASADECKLEDGRSDKSLNFDHYERNNGFPLQGALLPTQGKVNFLTFFVDFNDAMGSDTDLKYFRSQEKVFQNWFETASYGNLTAQITSSNKWFRADRLSKEYVLDPSQYGTHPKFAQEFLNLTSDHFNWKGVDAFIIHFPLKNNLQLQSAQLGRNVLLMTPQGSQRMNYQFYGPWQYQFAQEVKNKYPNYWAAQWLHENLHDFGLTLHAPGNGFNTGVGQSQLSYSLMLSGWELFKLGWITDDRVYCAPLNNLKKSTVRLLPLESVGSGNRILVIPTSSHKALVVESRRPIGLSKDWPQSMSGLFVYEIDTTMVTDRSQEFNGSGLDNGNNPKYPKWAFYLSSDQRKVDSTLPASKLNPEKYYQEWIVRKNETITTKELRVRFLASNDYDFVEITRI